MTSNRRKKRPKVDSDEGSRKIPENDLLTPSAMNVPSSDRCWKCKGKGLKFQKSTQSFSGPPCKVCNGNGIRQRSKSSKALASAAGKILRLRGYPEDNPLRKIFPDGFSGPNAFWGSFGSRLTLRNRSDGIDCDDNECNEKRAYDDLPKNLHPRKGEVVGSLGCGDWRIFQIANGNKLTVDDFICAWVAAEEMRKRGYGVQLHRDNAKIIQDTSEDNNCDEAKMFGGRTMKEMGKNYDQLHSRNQNDVNGKNDCGFNHADIGTGCGSVLMMIAWAFLGEVQSIGVEAQSISYDCLRRGLEWNLGTDGTSSKDVVQIRQNDLRSWDGCGVNEDTQSSCIRAPYHLMTGTPPYFPLDSFVASQNHEQKIRCRVPTRGGAPEYIETASRFLKEESCNKNIDGKKNGTENSDDSLVEDDCEGVFCMVEAAFDKAEAGVLDAVKKFNMRVRRRVDVVTRFGLPPRFSCWVMTKKNSSESNLGEMNNKNVAKNLNDSRIDRVAFPIETFTLRNADLSRTKEYTYAMEKMGWVDFEKSKLKTVKSLKSVINQHETIIE